MENIKKYPLGITPRIIIDKKRYFEINDAIKRYSDENLPIPEEWLLELEEIIKRFTPEQMILIQSIGRGKRVVTK